MKKRLFAILLALCLLAQLFPLTASAVRLDWPHPSAHCVCGGGISNHKAMNGHTTYEGVYFTKDGKENTSGDISKMNVIRSEADLMEINHKASNNQGKTFYYYLANDVTLTKRIHVWEGCTFVICLHGHTLTCNVPDAQSAFLVMNNARLVFTDCQLSGDRGLITGDSCAAVSVAEAATFELYGVSICMTSSETDGIRDVYNDPVCGVYNCGTYNMYGGCYYQKSSDYPTDRPVISNIRNTKYGPGVINRGTFNMYDGIISGNERNGVMSTITRSDDTINLYGGTITGNTDAGIAATHWPMPSIATSDYYTNINLYGGTISENTGAGIDAAYGRVTMAQQSSAIPAEIKNNKGGAISLTRDGSTANLGTGRITGNSGGKGAVALSAGSLTLTGDVKITGNTGANLYLASGKTVTLDKLGSAAEIGVTTESTAVPVVFAEANGTDYASRFTPDSAGYSIGYNAAQQLQLQTMTYHVTYAPGANGTGDSKTVNKEHDNALELEGALFTRLGYTQVGWSKHDGGEMDYSLNAIYEQNEALTLYPVWEERSDYTVHIVNQDGSKVMDYENVKWTDEIWNLLTPRPTRENDERLQALLIGNKRVMGGDTYGTFATGGEDSLTFVAFWSGVFIDYSTISVGDSQWTGFRSEGTEHFFNEDQTVQINTAHPEELSYFEYAVGDQFYSNGLAADDVLFSRGHDHFTYTGAFNTASLNLEEGKPYVIYAQLGTKLLARYGVVCTEKIIIDKTAPAITGAKNGDVFCGEGDKTLTVTDLYLDTVTVNGVAVTPNEQGEITLTDARTPQTVVATDKAGNSTTLTVTVHASHSYKWQTENGQYWGECEFCGDKVEKTNVPTLTITAPDAVCRTQDFEFSFNLPEGCTDPAYRYEFTFSGDGEPIAPVDGLCTGTIPAASYIAGETGFRFIASATTAEGYRFSVSKNITLREHSGGTATCTEQAVCDHCGQPYGALKAHSFTAETAEEQYLKSAATCTEKAVYYKSCAVCGASSMGTADEATFVSGKPLGHDWGAWTPDGDGTHKRVCAHDAGHVETADCTYGDWNTNQDSHWKTCTVCGGETERLDHSDPDCDHFCDTCGIKMTEHDFTGELPITALLYREANCLSPALYYKSCKICMLSSKGTDSEATFASGDKNPNRHAEDPGAWQTDADSHWRFYTCCHLEVDRGAHQGGTADCLAPALCEVCFHSYGELGPHHFVNQLNEFRLKSAATCTSPAVYYQSCSTCHAQGTGTFENGEPLGHDWGAWTSNGDGTHSRVCKRDALHTEGGDCSGGTATCTERAVCTTCGGAYGELAAHRFTAEKAEEQYLKSGATCTEKAVYYKSCAACGLTSKDTADESTFASGEPLGHDWGAWTSNGDGTHSRVCKRDASHTEGGDCSGGTATCTERAVCTTCGGAYGETDPEHHADGCTPEWKTTETEHEQSYSLCGKVLVARAAHTFGEWTVTQAPTPHENGEQERTCAICAYKQTQTLPATGEVYHTITASAGVGGSISPAGEIAVREGASQAFTFTPDSRYAVADVTVDGVSVGAVQTYTFENVDRAHTIAVSFVKLRTFVDVPEGSYYEEAVDWAAQNGITNGTDATHFSPDELCTRAQAVTFLWRKAGSPAPKSEVMPFTDVPVGSYYYDAVLWAVENGITLGTSATTFSPNETCTRAHIVTFLWRFERCPAAGGENPFSDVSSRAYYADAVLWAVERGITNGTSETTFGPDESATRAQIVTFLYRDIMK